MMFRVKGRDRKVEAIGKAEPFEITVDCPSHHSVLDKARAYRRMSGRDFIEITHVHHGNKLVWGFGTNGFVNLPGCPELTGKRLEEAENAR